MSIGHLKFLAIPYEWKHLSTNPKHCVDSLNPKHCVDSQIDFWVRKIEQLCVWVRLGGRGMGSSGFVWVEEALGSCSSGFFWVHQVQRYFALREREWERREWERWETEKWRRTLPSSAAVFERDGMCRERERGEREREIEEMKKKEETGK